MAKVSIIVLNYNGTSLTIDCLRALDRQIFTDFEVVLVDNGSSCESRLSLESYLEDNPLKANLRFVPLAQNHGFAGGNNKGLGHTTGDYIALLNNDTEPDQNWLYELVDAMNRHPWAGICASKILVHNSDLIDTAGDGFVRSLKGFKRGEGEIILFRNEEFVFGACAGAVLYQTENDRRDWLLR